MITFNRTVVNGLSPLVRKFGFRNAGNFCLGNLGIGIRNTGRGIRNPTNDWNPESKFHLQRLESCTWNPESKARNPEFKTVLDSITWERGLLTHYEKNLYPASNVARQSLPVSTRKQVQIRTYKISVFSGMHRGNFLISHTNFTELWSKGLQFVLNVPSCWRSIVRYNPILK